MGLIYKKDNIYSYKNVHIYLYILYFLFSYIFIAFIQNKKIYYFYI